MASPRPSPIRGPGSNQHADKPPRPGEAAGDTGVTSAAADASHTDPLDPGCAAARSFDGRLAREKPSAHPAAQWRPAEHVAVGDLLHHPDGRWRRVRRVTGASGGHVVIDTGRQTATNERHPVIVHGRDELQRRPASPDDVSDDADMLATVVDGSPVEVHTAGGRLATGHLEVLEDRDEIAHAHRQLEQAFGRSGDNPPPQSASELVADDRTAFAVIVGAANEPVAYARLDASDAVGGDVAWWQANELVPAHPDGEGRGRPTDDIDTCRRLNRQLDGEQQQALAVAETADING